VQNNRGILTINTDVTTISMSLQFSTGVELWKISLVF